MGTPWDGRDAVASTLNRNLRGWKTSNGKRERKKATKTRGKHRLTPGFARELHIGHES